MNYREKCLNEEGEWCNVCGSERFVEVHHKDGNRSNNELDNLIPLCRDCHKQVHHYRNPSRPELAKLGEMVPPIKPSPKGEPSSARKVQKTLCLPLPVVERLETESDDNGIAQSDIVADELEARYGIEVEA